MSIKLEELLQSLREEKTDRAAKIITPQKIKYAVCPYCGEKWITSRKGGGMVVQAANNHVKACSKNPNKEQS